VARRKEIVIKRNRIRRREPKDERNKGIRSRHIEELLHLRKKGKSTNSIGIWNRRLQPRLVPMRSSSNDVFGKTNGPGFGKREAGSPVALRKIDKWTLWKGRPPPKRKEEQEAEEEPVK
jgi:hypothetical protein